MHTYLGQGADALILAGSSAYPVDDRSSLAYRTASRCLGCSRYTIPLKKLMLQAQARSAGSHQGRPPSPEVTPSLSNDAYRFQMTPDIT